MSLHIPNLTTPDLAKRIRLHALRMTSKSGGSHVGAAFSCADILAVLYSRVLNVDPLNPSWPLRDRFVLSKGHAGSALYAVLAECGFFPVRNSRRTTWMARTFVVMCRI